MSDLLPVSTLTVTLEMVEPPVWRRVMVPTTASLAHLHQVIQLAMGWEDDHLHEFEVDGVRYAPDAGDDLDLGLLPPARDEAAATLGDVAREGSIFRYTYDFGDGWEHEIRVDAVGPADGGRYPRCTGGARACPPEDIGGPWGYAEALDALVDRRHERHDELVEWLGGPFDPERFDLAATDEAVGSITLGAGMGPSAGRPTRGPRLPVERDPSPSDEEAAFAAVEALLDRFGSWLAHHPEHSQASVDDARLALDWKWQRADGDLGWWVRDHLDDLLLGELPARYGASAAQAASIPGSLAALFTFLEGEGDLGPSSDPAGVLVARVFALQRSFLDAMDDPDHFGMAKRLTAAMGIEPGSELTQDDLDALTERFNTLPLAERDAILGAGPAPGLVQDEPPEIPLPLRDLPGPAEMDAQAEGVVMLERVDALWEGLGRGAALTPSGNLKLADGRRLVDLLGLDDPADRVRSTIDLPRLFSVVEVAMFAGAVQSTGKRLVPLADWPERSPGDRWQLVVDAVLEIGAASLAFGAREPLPFALAEEADTAVLYLLAMLWMSEEPLPEETLELMLLDGLDAGIVPPSTLRIGRSILGSSCRGRAVDAVGTLVDAGLIEVDDGSIRLRRGGDRIAVPWLEVIGFDATLPEDLVDLEADELLDRLAEGGLPVTDDLAAAWLGAGPGRAEALVAAAVDAPEPVTVLTALTILQHGDDDAVAAVRAARDTAIGPSAWLWLLERGEVEPDEVPPEATRESGVITMLAVLDSGSAADVVETLLAQVPQEDHQRFVTGLAEAEHPRTAELLEQVGRHHPDKAVGKHTRKLAHRWRSSHGASRRR